MFEEQISYKLMEVRHKDVIKNIKSQAEIKHLGSKNVRKKRL